jgi:DNA-binding CsgD family transcriptional regulator
MALIMQANAYAIRGERDEMEACIAEATRLAPKDRDVLGGAWGYCRATVALFDEDRELAWQHMSTGADLLLASPAAFAPPFLGLWPLLGAALGRDTSSATARVRLVHGSRRRVVAGLLGYCDAILAGRDGRKGDAIAAFAAGDTQLGPLVAWYRHYGRRLAAESALADGWGEPVSWLREAAPYFDARGDDKIAMACRGLLRQAGVPVPRNRASDADVPDRLRALGVTGREVDVLQLVARGLANREIAEQLVLSPRTVEKHVASLLMKTGLRRRAQLAGCLAELDG